MNTRLRLRWLLTALSLVAALALSHSPADGQGKGGGKGQGWGKGGKTVLKEMGNNNKRMAGQGVKKLPGMASTTPIAFVGVGTKEGVPWLHAKAEDGTSFEAPLMTAKPKLYDVSGATQPVEKIAAGAQLDAILYGIKNDYFVIGFRDDKSVIVKQHEMRITSADTMQERVTMTDKIAGTISVPVEGALLIDALGVPKRFSDIKTGSTVEAIWKDKPGSPTLILLRL